MRWSPRRVAASLCLLAGLALQSPPATSAPIKVQAGGPVANTRGQVFCTFNFVFTDGATNYIGTADHCYDDTLYPGAEGLRIGDRVRTGNVDEVTGRLGTDTEIGTVVASDGELDFALVKLDPGVQAVARVRGWGGPDGLAGHRHTEAGDTVLATGYGLAVGEVSSSRSRAGVLIRDDQWWFNSDIPAAPGDSGGPVMTRSGKALGIITNLGQSTGTIVTGPTVSWILERMAARGYNLTLVSGGKTSLLPSSTS